MMLLPSLNRLVALTAALLLAACATAPQSDLSLAPAPSDQIVLMIGIDGLRADAIDRFPDAALNLSALAGRGVRAAGMTPAMPSVTFVNFYSIATGLYAEHTGIVSNSSYSRNLKRVMLRTDHSQSEWWGGEPIWSTAEKQGVKTATMFWLGSEAKIAGARPTYWLPYDHLKPFPERTDEVLAWLALPEALRPRLVTVYFHAVDSAEHAFGVDSDEAREAVAIVDAEVGRLVAGVEDLGLSGRVNIIALADHGMADVPAGKIVNIDDYVPLDGIFVPELQGPEGAGMNAVAHIFVENGDVDGVYDALAAGEATGHFRVYRRAHLPARWRMNNPDRTGDIVVAADEGWLVFAKTVTPKYPGAPVGQHGYDRHLPSMQATFIADGPRFADHVVVEPFDNVEVYGMIADILGVRPAETDGDIARVSYFMTPAD